MTKPGWIAVVGDRIEGSEPQATIEPAVSHSATALGTSRPHVRWLGTEQLARDGDALLAGAAGVWCAPGGPFRSLDGALVGIRWAREQGVPFLGTCAGFQHAVIEFARTVLGVSSAAHAEYGHRDGDGELFVDELLCSLVGQTMQVQLTDPVLVEWYGTDRAQERYYCRFGLAPQWRPALEDAGLRTSGVDATDGDVRIMRLAGHPFFLMTLFVPQAASRPERPHPLVTAFVRAVQRGVPPVGLEPTTQRV